MNVTLRVQVPLGASVPHGLGVVATVKSVKVGMVTLETTRLAVPTLVRVIGNGPEAPPIVVVGKVNEDTLRDAEGAVAGLTVKATGAVGALVPAEFVALTSKWYTPVVPGVKGQVVEEVVRNVV